MSDVEKQVKRIQAMLESGEYVSYVEIDDVMDEIAVLIDMVRQSRRKI